MESVHWKYLESISKVNQLHCPANFVIFLLLWCTKVVTDEICNCVTDLPDVLTRLSHWFLYPWNNSVNQSYEVNCLQFWFNLVQFITVIAYSTLLRIKASYCPKSKLLIKALIQQTEHFNPTNLLSWVVTITSYPSLSSSIAIGTEVVLFALSCENI